MRLMLVLAVLALAGVAFYEHANKPPPPAPPPPVPPAITLAPQPVLSNDEMARVLESAGDPDPNVRWEAVKLLAQLNAPQTDEILVRMLRRDADAGIRKNTLDMLIERNGAKALPVVLEALHDESADIRLAALQALNKLGDYSVAGAISEMLHDPDQRIRLAALTSLNNLQTRKNEEIREEARRQEQIRQEMLRKQAEEAAKANSK